MAMFFVCMLFGCGGNNNAAAPATATAKSTFQFVDGKTQSVQFSLDANGNIEHLRSGGISVKPADVDYVVWSSYRFGDYKTSPYKVSGLEAPYKATFTGLPNNDQWIACYVVLKSGEKFKVELSQFEIVNFSGLYSWISPENSEIEYGDIEADSAQDGMAITLNRAEMVASIHGQFGCDLIFGTEQPVKYEAGMKVVFENFKNGTLYVGDIVKGVDGNLSFDITGIPVIAGPYGEYYGNYATTLKIPYILMADGTRVNFIFPKTGDYDDENSYTWYIAGSYNQFGQVTADIWSDPIVIRYYPGSDAD